MEYQNKRIKLPTHINDANKHSIGQTFDPEILEFVDTARPIEELNELSIKKMVLKLEKSISKNQEMRVKYADQPQKFLESEADLDSEIKNFLVLSTSPEHYPLLVRFDVLPSILGLLTHENSDIANSVVELLKEWTDEDVLGESDEELIVQFTDHLIQHNLVELVVENLCRLDESLSADKQGVESTLSLIENLAALRPDEIDTRLVQKTKLLPWITKRVQVPTMDSNRLNAVEILAILLQRSKESKETFMSLGGIEILLQILSQFRKRSSSDLEEKEFIENIFDILCSCLLEPNARKLFLEAQGIQLSLLLIQDNRTHKLRTLKMLNYALSTFYGIATCQEFMSCGGVAALLSILDSDKDMEEKKLKTGSPVEKHEHVFSILASLFVNLADGASDHVASVKRLLVVFKERDFFRLKRLILYRYYYHHCVMKAEQMEHDSDDEEEAYIRKLDFGLFTLQNIDLCIAHLCELAPDEFVSACQNILKNDHGLDLQHIKDSLEDYLSHLGDESDDNMQNQDLVCFNFQNNYRLCLRRMLDTLCS